MDKAILQDYIDACELVKETEEEIRRIKRQIKTIVQGVVKGSSPDFPYTPQNFHIEGLSYSVIQDPGRLETEERRLEERRAAAEAVKVQVEAWMATIPMRMQRIIRYKVFDGMTWMQVAQKLGRGTTENGLKKEYERFMRKT